MSLVIIRGLPGSGKSTLAHAMIRSGEYVCDWVEADQFMTKTGERKMNHGGIPALQSKEDYIFNASWLPDAHRKCYEAVEESLRVHGAAIVSNTFTRRSEYQHYIQLAKKYNVPVQVIEVHGNFGSVHDVPEKTLRNMRDRWEPHTEY